MRPTTLLASLALVFLPALAHADANTGGANRPTDPQVARLLDAKKTLKWNYAPPGRSERYGHAEALVAAPADKVAKVATDFGHYKELHRKFATARVVGKEGDNTDVYMRYPVQIGAMKVEFWEVMRFGGLRVNDGTHFLEGNGVKGDMKQGRTAITVKPIDAKHSLLTVDVVLIPKIPAPQFLIDEELRDGAEDFVNGVKDRAQGFVGPVTAL
jgi:carbon monoxide dehydrogenase subunit G